MQKSQRSMITRLSPSYWRPMVGFLVNHVSYYVHSPRMHQWKWEVRAVFSPMRTAPSAAASSGATRRSIRTSYAVYMWRMYDAQASANLEADERGTRLTLGSSSLAKQTATLSIACLSCITI
jgi:hypothetical protein